MALSKRAKKNISDAMKARWAAKRAEKTVIDSAKKVTENVLGQMPEKTEGGSYNQITGSSGNSVKELVRDGPNTIYQLYVCRPDGTRIELVERVVY